MPLIDVPPFDKCNGHIVNVGQITMPSSPGFAVLVGPPLVVDSDCCCCCLRLSLVLLVLFQVDQRLGRIPVKEGSELRVCYGPDGADLCASFGVR